MYYTAMQNLDPQKKRRLLITLSLILALVLWINLSDPLAINAQKSKQSKNDQSKFDPAKDFQSLDNHINYLIPEGWGKIDQVDKQFGKSTNIALTSPDFVASNSSVVKSGTKIWISRSYDLKVEETLNNKLNTKYPIYNYNVMAFKVGGRNAMTIYEDLNEHNRFVYIAQGNHLWQITVSSKSLEDEQKYQTIIDAFLDSIRFKD